jgi:glutamate-ammonia-ligase adenylyltransferase
MTAGPGRKDNSLPLRQEIIPSLKPIDAERGHAWLADLRSAADEAGAGRDAAALLADPGLSAFVAALVDESRFLRHIILDRPAHLFRLLDAPAAKSLDRLCEVARASWRDADPQGMMATLRQSRADLALLVAIADLGGVWTIDESMAALSRFADAAIAAAADSALVAQHNAGNITLPDLERPHLGSGWIILAVGKLGACELNYSSDVDLIVLFDPSVAAIPGDRESAKIYIGLTQAMIRTLSEHTADGYVLRTDLRLRPDPGSTSIAISVPAALLYYETQGQNWERAALIKARPIAGDLGAGRAFLDELSPFLWRKYLDYAAIADIHSIKRQIHDHRGHASIAIAGHNLKLGRGGIREIEFFVQTQQLIAGGRHPELRGRDTLGMLDELAKEGWIQRQAADELASAYRLLRRIEHRLQMVNDEQTHTLPDDTADLLRIARLSGTADIDTFERLLRPALEATQRYYEHLFEEAPALSGGAGNLVFTGDEDDPETLQTLSAMGFADPVLVSRLVRGWHFGRYAATRSATARERLTEITPALLEAFARDGGDGAVLAFDRLLSRMPAGVQMFALFASNPWLLSLLAAILGAAPRLADLVTRRPHTLDAIIDPVFFGSLPDLEQLGIHLRQTMDQAVSYEDALDRARIFGQEQAFLIGARILAGSLDARRAGHAFASLADLMVDELLRVSQDAIASAHGEIPGGKVAVMAMGKLGGREMTAASDLDLILLYEFPNGTAGSDGERPLSPSQYYARLTQRLVAALSAPTAEGRLYDVDFRLRPSGNSGPLATSIDGFIAYQTADAWTWEHMALTRARLVAGDPGLVRTTEAAIAKILGVARDDQKLAADVREMRATIEAEKGSAGIWDIKLAPGGLTDVEFIAQYLQLQQAAKHPQLLRVETEASLDAAAEAGVLSPAHAEILLPALRLYQDLTQIIRLCVDEPFNPEEAPAGLKSLLAQAAEVPDFARLEAHLGETEASVRRVFDDLIGKEA